MNSFGKAINNIRSWLQRTFTGNSIIHVVPYHGYGNERIVYQRGRVLHDKKVAPSVATDSAWRNLMNAWKRFESDEVGGAKVRASINGVMQETMTNSEGYFEFIVESETPLSRDKLWHELEIELLAPRAHKQKGRVMIPPTGARFGVISDMDDTVLQTDATNLLRVIKNVAFGNARTRLPFKGVAAFYRALHEEDGKPINPLYYVSSSPWNLYDLLMEFFHLQNIPVGPLVLRDWGASSDSVPYKHRDHKIRAIQHIMDLVRDLPFILIGDSGQQDPEIYHEILSLYPERILAIYIRNVSRDLERPAAIRELAKKVIEAGSTMILTDDTLAAAKHAVEMGWIRADSFPEIVAEKIADEKPTEEKKAPTVKVEAAENSKSDIDQGLIEDKLKSS